MNDFHFGIIYQYLKHIVPPNLCHTAHPDTKQILHRVLKCKEEKGVLDTILFGGLNLNIITNHEKHIIFILDEGELVVGKEVLGTDCLASG